MGLIAFKAKNHPQQTRKRGVDALVDDRHTPPTIFDPLHERYGFTLDVAASRDNALCPRYFDVTQNALVQSWAGERVWCNPPYSDLQSWILKAHAEVIDGTCPLVVQLVPANRTEQGWWQDYVEPYRDRDLGGAVTLTTEFLRGRQRFKRPGWVKPVKGDRPPFGVCLLVWEQWHGCR